MARKLKPLSKAAQNRQRNIKTAKQRYRRMADYFRNQAMNMSDDGERELYMRGADYFEGLSAELNGIDVRRPSTITKRQNFLIKDSKTYLVRNMKDDWIRGEILGKVRLSDSNEGHRFFALTENLWVGADYEDRYDAIRRQLRKNMSDEMRKEYGPNPNVSDMINIISQTSEIEITEEPLPAGYREMFMGGIKAVLVNYG